MWLYSQDSVLGYLLLFLCCFTIPPALAQAHFFSNVQEPKGLAPLPTVISKLGRFVAPERGALINQDLATLITG